MLLMLLVVGVFGRLWVACCFLFVVCYCGLLVFAGLLGVFWIALCGCLCCVGWFARCRVVCVLFSGLGSLRVLAVFRLWILLIVLDSVI